MASPPAGDANHYLSIPQLERTPSLLRRHPESAPSQEEWVRSILKVTPCAIFCVDERGYIRSCNASAERMFGYSAAELLQQSIAPMIPWPLGTWREGRGRRRNGTTFPLDLGFHAYQEGSQHFTTIIVRDLTQLRRLQQEVVEIATQEQRRIGQELHDCTGQELLGLRLLAESLVDLLQPSQSTELAVARRIAEGLGQALRQVQNLARGMIPLEVDAQGLMTALEDLARHVTERSGIACTFECEPPVLVSDNLTALHLVRIAQEATTNAIKHSGAQHIQLLLTEDSQALVMTIQDDGRGIPQHLEHSDGMGLRTMRYRAALIGASLGIGPTSCGGTLVRCTLSGETRNEHNRATCC